MGIESKTDPNNSNVESTSQSAEVRSAFNPRDPQLQADRKREIAEKTGKILTPEAREKILEGIFAGYSDEDRVTLKVTLSSGEKFLITKNKFNVIQLGDNGGSSALASLKNMYEIEYYRNKGDKDNEQFHSIVYFGRTEKGNEVTFTSYTEYAQPVSAKMMKDLEITSDNIFLDKYRYKIDHDGLIWEAHCDNILKKFRR